MTQDSQNNEPASWRCFIALEISDDVRASATRIQSLLRKSNADVSYPHPDRMHLTILFLGDTLTGKIEPLKTMIDSTTATIAPFTLAYQGLGFFGPPRHPRVVWAGLAALPPEILSLRQKLLAAITELGFSLDQRAFRPHLTLGRIRSARGLASLTARVESLKDASLGSCPVTRVLLLRSHLDQPEARYETVYASNLTGA